MPTLPLPSGVLNLALIEGRDRTFTATVSGLDIDGYSHLAQFRETDNLNSNVLFELTSDGTSASIVVSGQVVTFQISATDTDGLGGKTIYWSWKITDPDGLTNDFLEGYVTINTTPTE